MVKRLASRHGPSLSQEARDLIREAVELHEDRSLDELAEGRRASRRDGEALTAEELRARLGRRSRAPTPGELSFEVRFHPEFEEDLRRMPRNVRARVLAAVEERLGSAPDRYGQRLRQSLHGYWKLRVGDDRVDYEIVERSVRVYGVIHIRDVYARIEGRMGRSRPQRRRRAPSPVRPLRARRIELGDAGLKRATQRSRDAPGCRA